MPDDGLRADPDGGVNTLTTLNLEEPGYPRASHAYAWDQPAHRTIAQGHRHSSSALAPTLYGTFLVAADSPSENPSHHGTKRSLMAS